MHALEVMLAPGMGGRGGVHVLPYDVSFGPEASAQERSAIARNAAGTAAWARIAQGIRPSSHRVMYFRGAFR